MNKKLIAQLAAGEVILENNLGSNLKDKIRKIISLAFGDERNATGESAFYFKCSELTRGWLASSERIHECMPACAKYVKASEFLKEDEEEFAWGDRIKHEASFNTYIYVGEHPLRKEEIICCSEKGVVYNLSKNRISKLPLIKEVTLKEVAEKFGVSVEQIRIKE